MTPESSAWSAGGCLCGGVHYQVAGPLRGVIDCHCERCRRTTGHHMAATSVDVNNLTLNDDGNLTWYHPSDDPRIGYGFCGTCGSSLFWRNSDDSTTWSICAGTLDQPTGLSTELILYASEAADHVRLDPLVEQRATE